MPLIWLVLALVCALTGQADAAYFIARSTAPSAPPSADAYFAATGVDSGGATIGTDCTYAAPCQSVDKLLAFHAAQVASNPNRNYSYVMLSPFGSYAIGATKLYNSTHTVSPGYTTTIQGWPTNAVWSGGYDTAGSWSSTTLPSGASGCVSNYLASYAPLTAGTTTTTAPRYVGVMWIGGQRVETVMWPRVDQAPDRVVGTAGTSVGSTSAPPTTLTFTSGSTSIGVSDMSAINGVVGDPLILVADTTTAGFTKFRPYWIASKSAATGAGTITVAASPGGAAQSATASTTAQLSEQTATANLGQRYSMTGKINVLPINSGRTTSYNPTDVKLWWAVDTGSGQSVLPVRSITSSTVTLDSRWFRVSTAYAGAAIRWIGRFEDLGTNGYVGELYTDRTSGNIYVTPPSGYTCSSLNVAGTAIIPGAAETLLKASSATADGSTSAAAVGRLNITGVTFRHTNTAFYTKAANIAGVTGGFQGWGDSFAWYTLEPAVLLIGAQNVTFNGVRADHLGGSGMTWGWGSHDNSMVSSVITDVGGHGLNLAMNLNAYDNFRFNADSGYAGTSSFSASTPSYNTKLANKDLTGASDRNNSISYSYIGQVGRTYWSSSCLSAVGWRESTISHNTFRDCPLAAIQQSSISLISAAAPDYGGSGNWGLTAPGNWGTTIADNLMEYSGYMTSLAGVRIAGVPHIGDAGQFYIQGPQDGDGTQVPLTIARNVGHDSSAACDQAVSATGTVGTHGWDMALDYHDGNNTGGYIETDNLFYNSSSVSGSQPCGTRLTQHTGGQRAYKARNIWAGNFPSGWTMAGKDYGPRVDVPLYNQLPARSQAYTCTAGAPCSLINSSGNFYTATASGTSGSTSATIPSCATVGCVDTDGTMSWTLLKTLVANSNIPGSYAYGQTETSNVTYWSGGSAADFPQYIAGFCQYPYMTKTDYSVYYHAGNTTSYYNNLGMSCPWSTWQGTAAQDANAAIDANPNFVDPTGASGWAGFRFKTSTSGVSGEASCSGTGGLSIACAKGFVPADYTNVGATVGP